MVSRLYKCAYVSNQEFHALRLILLVIQVVSDGFPLKWAAFSGINSASTDAWAALKLREYKLYDALLSWHARFLAYRAAASHELDPVQETISSNVLLLRYRSIHFWLIGSTELDEMAYDRYLPQFRSAIEGARDTLEIMESHGMLPEFSFELGLIPPL